VAAMAEKRGCYGDRYSMSSDFISILKDLSPEVIPSKKNGMNIGLIVNGYRAVNICNSR
jgi:hypothetical protein